MQFPCKFDGSVEKHSRSKAPSSVPINPMAPTAKQKQQRSSAKVGIPRIHTIAVAIIWTEEGLARQTSYVSSSPGTEPSLAPLVWLWRGPLPLTEVWISFKWPSSSMQSPWSPMHLQTFNTRSTTSRVALWLQACHTAANLGPSRQMDHSISAPHQQPWRWNAAEGNSASANVQHQHIIDLCLVGPVARKKPAGCRQLYLSEPQICTKTREPKWLVDEELTC